MGGRGIFWSGLVALLLIAGCARREAPAPVDVRGGAQANGPVTNAPVQASVAVPSRPNLAPDGTYLVQRGDTLSAVARRFDLPPRSLIDANNLRPPFGLLVGQRLIIPKPTGHTVEAGETLYSISRRYNVDMSTLVRANNLTAPYGIRVGQRLTLPAQVATGTTEAALPPPVVAPIPEPPQAPIVSETVQSEALPSPGVIVPPPPVANTPAPPAPPQVAAVPPRPPVATPPPPPPVPVVTPPAPPPPVPAPPVAPPVAQAAPEPPPVAATEPAAAEPAAAPSPPTREIPIGPPPPRGGKTFLWPVRGRVLATYGTQGAGIHNDGINIAAARGTPIRAAENGVVAYAGNEIRGFGNLLLIRHADGFVTAYAHADTLTVKRGDVVRRGQTIGRVGLSGNVAEPQVHFEIRQGTQAVDPERLLGSPSA